MRRTATGTLVTLILVTFALFPSARGDHVDPSDIITVLPPDAIPAITSPSFDGDESWLAGDRGALDAGVGLAGAFLLVAGGYLAWEATNNLESSARRALGARLLRGLLVGSVAALGMATIYLAIGLAFNLGLSRFPSVLPWIAFGSASVVVVLGVLLFFGRNPASFVPKLRAPSGRGLPSYLFGMGYALIASGCFLPVFALVVGAALAVGIGDAVQVMLAYAAGSALILLMVSVSAGAAEGLVFQTLRVWRRHVHRVAGVVVIAMGAYVLWYDWTFLLSKGV